MKMGAPVEIRQRADLGDYLAAERTLFAWNRIGLALMGIRIRGGAVRTLAAGIRV